MIGKNTLAMFKARYDSLSVDGQGDAFNGAMVGLTLGLVVNTDDPLQSGRLQVFCPALNDNPKKIMHLPWAAYISPFAGSIDNENYTRGTGDGTSTSKGAVHYGFWAVPELGAHVLVGCVDGDPRRRFFMGALPEHQETHTQFNGRFDWSSKKGTPDGPLTSTKNPIQPIYDNWTAAFVDRASPEWKSRGADYQVTANPSDGNGTPTKLHGVDYLDDSYEGMSKFEKDEWVKEIMGSHGYDWSGFKNAGPFKSSRVYGMSTPGFHSFSMDDRPFNSRIKFRTASGHQFLMDDTNERIHIMTSNGESWVEMDKSGNIDVYSGRRVSINAAKDINMTTGGTFRVHAAEGIHLFAGHINTSDTPSLSEEYRPQIGEIRIQAENDIHNIANNIRTKSIENTYNEIGISKYDLVGESTFLDVTKDINIRTITGDYIKSIAKNLSETVGVDSKRLSYGKNAMSSNGDNEVFSFLGGISMGSTTDMSIKSITGDVNMEATGIGGSGGNINSSTPKSQQTVGEGGVRTASSGKIVVVTGDTISHEFSPVKTDQLNDGPILLGASAPVSGSAIIMGAEGIIVKSAQDIKMKTNQVFNSFSDMSNKLDSVITETNTVGIYSLAVTAAVGELADAVGKTFHIPVCGLDLAALKAALFNAIIPPILGELYSDITALSNEIQNLLNGGLTEEFLGLVGVTLPLDVNDLVNVLQNNTNLLTALQLPPDLQFLLNGCGGIVTEVLERLNLPVETETIEIVKLPDFRPLVHKIFKNNTL